MMTTRMEGEGSLLNRQPRLIPMTGGADDPPGSKPPVVFAEPPEFKPGDVVHMKSTPYPLMTVEAVYSSPVGRIIKTVWFAPDASLKRDTFDPELLQHKEVPKQ